MPNSRAKIIEEQMKIETKINYSLRMLHIRLRSFDKWCNGDEFNSEFFALCL